MKSQRPYLLRALYDWIIDSGEIPHLLVDATLPDVVVPTEYVNDGEIVLNIGPNAIRNLQLGDEWLMFSSRFGGKPFEIELPVASVKAIYARDNGAGMVFPEEQIDDVTEDSVQQDDESSDDDPDPPKPNLRLV